MIEKLITKYTMKIEKSNNTINQSKNINTINEIKIKSFNEFLKILKILARNKNLISEYIFKTEQKIYETENSIIHISYKDIYLKEYYYFLNQLKALPNIIPLTCDEEVILLNNRDLISLSIYSQNKEILNSCVKYADYDTSLSILRETTKDEKRFNLFLPNVLKNESRTIYITLCRFIENEKTALFYANKLINDSSPSENFFIAKGSVSNKVSILFTEKILENPSKYVHRYYYFTVSAKTKKLRKTFAKLFLPIADKEELFNVICHSKDKKIRDKFAKKLLSVVDEKQAIYLIENSTPKIALMFAKLIINSISLEKAKFLSVKGKTKEIRNMFSKKKLPFYLIERL